MSTEIGFQGRTYQDAAGNYVAQVTVTAPTLEIMQAMGQLIHEAVHGYVRNRGGTFVEDPPSRPSGLIRPS
jgi:hypothetical protein